VTEAATTMLLET